MFSSLFGSPQISIEEQKQIIEGLLRLFVIHMFMLAFIAVMCLLIFLVLFIGVILQHT